MFGIKPSYKYDAVTMSSLFGVPFELIKVMKKDGTGISFFRADFPLQHEENLNIAVTATNYTKLLMIPTKDVIVLLIGIEEEQTDIAISKFIEALKDTNYIFSNNNSGKSPELSM